jgi:hypothetical protein
MNTVKVRFDGQVFIPEKPVDLPVGSELEIPIPSRPPEASPIPTLTRLAEIAEQFPVNPDLPADLAAQHDHYLYGTPKRP